LRGGRDRVSVALIAMGPMRAFAAPRSTLEVDVERLDTQVEAAIRAGAPRGLRVLGYGEITLVIGWPTEDPVVAVKRLPPFVDSGQLEAYGRLLERYVQVLRERHIPVARTELLAHPGPNGSARGYLVQPLVRRERHLSVILESASAAQVRELLELVVDHVDRSVDHAVGLDAQASNWWFENGELSYYDVSTPMLRNREGREQLDVSLFLGVYPWLARPVLARIAPSVMAQYHDRRTVLLDFASNLHKEGLDHCVPALLHAANGRLERPLLAADVSRYFRQDKLLWEVMQRLRRTDQSWQRRVRHRPYPFLLPPPYRYGPSPRIKEHAR
jgi:hypothetical protein